MDAVLRPPSASQHRRLHGEAAPEMEAAEPAPPHPTAPQGHPCGCSLREAIAATATVPLRTSPTCLGNGESAWGFSPTVPHSYRVIGKKIYLLIANEQHLSLLACKQGNLALLLH